MTSQIIIRVEKDLKDIFQRLSRIEQKSVNAKIRELMEEYVKEHNIEEEMKSIWDDIGRSLKKKGYKEPDVEKMLRKVRTGK